MEAVTIRYNLVEAHYKIAELEDEIQRLENQRDSFKEGLRDYAESFWWNVASNNDPRKLDKYVDDAERDYTLDNSS